MEGSTTNQDRGGKGERKVKATNKMAVSMPAHLHTDRLLSLRMFLPLRGLQSQPEKTAGQKSIIVMEI
jgi:hypothetical protein